MLIDLQSQLKTRNHIWQAFEAAVAAAPGRTALICGDETRSYQQLAQRADEVAAAIIMSGIELQSPVAMRMDRSFELVATVLGILRAGCCYTFLDKRHPEDHCRRMLDGIDCRMVIAASPGTYANRTLTVIPHHSGAAAPREGSFPSPDGKHGAYIIYTSGSTGSPKAILGQHCSVLHRLSGFLAQVPFDPAERCIFRKSLSFVGSVTELFEPLLCGIPVEIIEDRAVDDPFALVEIIRAKKITRLWTFPSLLRPLLDILKASPVAGETLRYVFTSGSSLDRPAIERFYEILPQAQLINTYGSTEVTSDVTYGLLTAASEEGWIGRPLPHCMLRVVDGGNHPCVDGEPGELVVGGPLVASGYFGGSADGDRFFEDPVERRRFFRTADRAIRNPDGTFRLVGRLSREVKVNDFRVNLDEVERALATMPGLVEAAVAVRSGPNASEIHAFIVDHGRLGLAQIRERLAQQLPSYALPAVYFRLASLPKTLNGKISHSALSAESGQRLASDGHLAPRNPLEHKIHAIWTECLKVQGVSVREEFFSAGGTSIMAFQVISRISEVTGLLISPADFIACGTIEKQAELLGREEKAATSPDLAASPAADTVGLTSPQLHVYATRHSPALARAYVIAGALNVRHPADRSLREAVHALIERHEGLRVTVLLRDGNYCQRITEPDGRMVGQLDDKEFAAKYGGDALACLQTTVQQLDPPSDRLANVLLVEHERGQATLFYAIHHAIADWWSLLLLKRELELLLGGQPLQNHLPRYGAVMQRRLVRETTDMTAAQYWRARLKGSASLSTFPGRKIDRTASGRPARREQFRVSTADHGAFRDLCRRLGITLAHLMYGATGIVLSRYAQQNDILVGVPFHGRTTPDEGRLFGMFVNPFPFRLAIDDALPAETFLRQVAGLMTSDLRHAAYPLSHMLAEASIPRHEGHNPGYQILLNAYEYQAPDPSSPVRLDILEIPFEREAKLDASFTVVTSPDSLELFCDYHSGLYDAASVASWMEAILAVAASMVADPQRTVGQTSHVSSAARERVARWNRTSADFDASMRLTGKIAAVAARSPEVVAVRKGASSYTYREIDFRSNHLARQILASSRDNQEPFVPILSFRSIDLPVAILAVMKAGKAFVPINPYLPPEKIAEQLGEIRSSVALVHKDFPLSATQDKVCLRFGEAQESPEAPAVEASTDYLYAIFTSGTTGKPKAAINYERGIRNRLQWMDLRLGREAAGVTLQTTQHFFDSAVWQFLWPLVHGGCVVIPEDQRETDAEYMLNLISTQGITTVDFVPSVLRTILSRNVGREGAGGDLSSLRCVIIGGEELTPKLADDARRLFSGAQLINLYGPTETSIGCIYHQFNKPESEAIPIGRPIANCQAVVVDARGHLCPPGMKGELLIGGECVGAGYLRDEERTMRAFIPNHFSFISSETLYRTGDVCSFRSDGVIDFHGRLDSQVKIRGFRLELTEIAAAINKLPLVRSAHLTVERDAQGDAYLHAYLVVNRPAVTSRDIRQSLRSYLPVYAIPQEITFHESFPQAVSGKIDLAALRQEARPLPVPVAPLVLSGNTEFVHGVWQEVIGAQIDDLDANFYDLGGNSVMVPKVLARLRDQVPSLTVMDLFEHSNIRGLAAHLDGLTERSDAQA